MNQNLQRIKYIVCDLLATTAGWLLFYVYRFDVTGFLTAATLQEFLSLRSVLTSLILGPMAWMLLHAFSGYYQKVYFKSYISELQTTFMTCLVGCLVAFFAMVIDDVPFVNEEAMGIVKIVHVSPKIYLQILLTMFGCIFTPVYVLRYLITHHSNTLIQEGRLGLRTLMIGNGKYADQLVRELKAEKCKNGLITVAQCPSDASNEEIDRMVTQHHIEAFLLAPDLHDQKILDRLIYQLLPFGLPIRTKATNEEMLNGMVHVESLTTLPMIEYSTNLLGPFYRNVKRGSDILVSLCALVVLSPLYLALALAVRLDSPGPVFFMQERIGLSGRPFQIIKFRSMRVGAETEGPQLSSKADQRITRLGHYLRKYRLDEIPQFWNVLRGDMSLVGPRPERDYFIRQIMEIAPHYSRLLQVRPGITSWGQVKYGYASTIFQIVERMRYDLLYVDNCSIGMDLKILGYTVKIVLTGKGI